MRGLFVVVLLFAEPYQLPLFFFLLNQQLLKALTLVLVKTRITTASLEAF